MCKSLSWDLVRDMLATYITMEVKRLKSRASIQVRGGEKVNELQIRPLSDWCFTSVDITLTS